MPVPGWNDSFAGVSFQPAAFTAMFTAAIDERYRAALNTATHFTTHHTPAAGANLQKASSAAPASATGVFSVRYLQAQAEALLTLGSGWAATRRWTGAAYVAVADYAGQAEVPTWTFDGAAPSIVGAILGGNGWTRKYPREYADAAATAYTDAAAFANGHRARNLADGRVYARTAGAWVYAGPTAGPDRVTAYGRQQAGDYLGAWLWTELRDVLNALVWLRQGVGINAGSQGFQSITGTGATAAAAKADADAQWAAPGPNTGNAGGQTADAFELGVVRDFTTTVGGFETGLWARHVRYEANTQTQVTSSTDFYLYTLRPAQFDTHEYSANGHGYAEGALALIETQASGVAAPLVSGLIGGSKPAWPAGTPAAGQGIDAGWLAAGPVQPVYVVERLTGLTYQP